MLGHSVRSARLRRGVDCPVSERRESNVRLYCRSFPAMFARAKGAVVYVADGRPFLEILAGAGARSHGDDPGSPD